MADAPQDAASFMGFGRYLGPSHWPAWALWLWMRVTARLPLSLALSIHARIGALVYALAPPQRAIVLRNIELAFPALSPGERARLARRHFKALGTAFAECAFAWCASDRRLEGCFEVTGLEHLQRALERRKGVILYTGHFTSLEICARPLKQALPLFACMFSHRSNPLLNELQRRGRMRCAHESIPRDRVRSMLASLKRNAVVWYAPDQARVGRNAEPIPFFGEPAMTSTATSRLARLSGAAVLPFWYGRVEAGYRLQIEPPLEGFPTSDPVADTRRLVAILERFVRACPEQYFWSQKKFKRGPGFPDPYKPRA